VAGAAWTEGGATVLWATAMFFFLLWTIGMIGSNAMGGYHHVLLGVSGILFLVHIIRSRSRRRRGNSKT
jgi:hypothetical protein